MVFIGQFFRSIFSFFRRPEDTAKRLRAIGGI